MADAAAAGADGLLILDLPPDEAEQNSELISSGGLDPIRLIAPTTPPERMAKIVATAKGFIYYVSREGVTGEQSRLADTIAAQVAELRKHTDLPIAVGFGISTREQAAFVAKEADAVVVGSAVVRQIAENGDAPDLATRVGRFCSATCASHEVRLALRTHATLLHQMNGAGNDFVMIDNRDGALAVDTTCVALLCDRHRGVGADGMSAVEPAQEGADFRMRSTTRTAGKRKCVGMGRGVLRVSPSGWARATPK